MPIKLSRSKFFAVLLVLVLWSTSIMPGLAFTVGGKRDGSHHTGNQEFIEVFPGRVALESALSKYFVLSLTNNPTEGLDVHLHSGRDYSVTQPVAIGGEYFGLAGGRPLFGQYSLAGNGEPVPDTIFSMVGDRKLKIVVVSGQAGLQGASVTLQDVSPDVGFFSSDMSYHQKVCK